MKRPVRPRPFAHAATLVGNTGLPSPTGLTLVAAAPPVPALSPATLAALGAGTALFALGTLRKRYAR